MIFKKLVLSQRFEKTEFWSINKISIEKIIEKKKYVIVKKHNQISIKRGSTDIIDSMFTQFQKIAIAKGKINKTKTELNVNFEIQLRNKYKYGIITITLLLALLTSTLLFIDWKISIIMAFATTLLYGMHYFLYNFCITAFKEELEKDINNLRSL